VHEAFSSTAVAALCPSKKKPSSHISYQAAKYEP
jgi:hypothetical protein